MVPNRTSVPQPWMAVPAQTRSGFVLRVSCSLPLVTTRSLATPVAGPGKIDHCGKRPHR